MTNSDIDDYYSNIYKDRWQALKDSFFLQKEYENVSQTGEFFIDKASVFVANLLPIAENEKIIDVCSSPGGKALSILKKTNNTNIIYLNELSKNRFFRLRNNILTHVKQSQNIKFLNMDGRNFYKKTDEFDKILLDVPCSSERHLFLNEKYLKDWSLHRTKSLSIQAHSLLQSALMSLKSGGKLLYSTCAVSPKENEQVIARTLKKKKVYFFELEIDTIYQRADYGYYIMPDKNQGLGPLYFCLLEKR